MKATLLPLVFSLAPVLTTSAQTAGLSNRLQWADVNGDGVQDVFLILPGGAGRLLLGRVEGGFVDATVTLGLSTVGATREARWRNPDGGGAPELLLLSEEGQVCLYTQDVAGVFTPCSERLRIPPSTLAENAWWNDFDLDGDEDLLLESKDGVVLILRSEETGELVPIDLGLDRAEAVATGAVPLEQRITLTAPANTSENPDRLAEPTTQGTSANRKDALGFPSTAPPKRTASTRNPPAAGGTYSSSPSLPISLPAAPAIRDQATGGMLKASSSPTLGMLFPLSPQFYLDALSGSVGIGTTNPDASLHVAFGNETTPSAALGDFIRIGNDNPTSLGLDDDEIQARSNGLPSILKLNETGGDISIGGTPDGFSWSRVGINTPTPESTFQITNGGETGLFGQDYLLIGGRRGRNLGFDEDEVQARSNNRVATLKLNEDGGDVTVGALGSSRLAIGTASPQATLHVFEGLDTTVGGGDFLRIGSSASFSLGLDDDEIQARQAGGFTSSLKLNEDGGSVTIGSSSSPSTSTRLGIGTLTPVVSVHVARGSSSTQLGGDFIKTGTTAGANLGLDDDGIVARFNGSRSTLHLNDIGGDVVLGSETTRGRVGIGTSTPQFDVHVRGDGATGTILVTPNAANSNAELRLAENTSASLGAILRYNGATNDLEMRGFTTSGESGVQFFVDRDSGVAGFPTSSAKVGIGTSAPTFNLHVNGTAGKPGGGSWSVASDRRLKKNVHALEGALERLMRLRGVTYEYRDPEAIHELPGEQIGMIAQEVAEVFPDWVEEAEDGYLRLSIRGFEALTVEALRELREEKEAEIEVLRAENEQRVAALQRENEERVETLRSANEAQVAALREELTRTRSEQAERIASLQARLETLAGAMND